MRKLIQLEIVLLPCYTIGFFISGKYVSQSHILAGLIAVVFFMWILAQNPRFKKYEVSWTLPFWIFLFIGIVGLLLSPFDNESWPKGLIQTLGIFTMLLMATAMVVSLQKWSFLLSITKILVYSLAIFSIIGILQFILYNFTSMGKLLDFSFLNSIAGGSVWRDAGKIGFLYRANSIAAEPAHFTRYLGAGTGLALLRLGFLGKEHRKHISSVMPYWTSVAILGGYVVSLSILGWLLLGIVGLSLFFMMGKIKIRSLLSVGGIGAILIGALVIVAQITGGAYFDKVRTLSIIFSGDIAENQIQTNQLSALGVASNLVVAENNFLRSPLLGGGLGSHPLAYDIYAPSYVFNSRLKALDHMNAEDAASLFLRLLSETGILGLILFSGGCLLIIYRSRKIIVHENSNSINVSLSLGLSSSFAGIFAIYLLRAGHYYDPVFWVSLAFAAAVPGIMKNNN